MHYVYIYRKPDGTPFYVGKGSGSREIYHLNEARKINSKDKNLLKINTIRKILKTGLEPTIQIIDSNLPENVAFDLEKFLIQEIGRVDLNTGPLTNLTDGGEGVSGSIRDLSGKNNPNYGKIGELSPNYGRKHSKESLEKISKAHKGVAKSEEAKNNMRKPKSELGREAIANARKNSLYRPSEETKLKIKKSLIGRASAMKGKSHTDESKMKMSLSHKGKPKQKLLCPHCKKSIAINLFNRFHNNNCKLKEKINDCA